MQPIVTHVACLCVGHIGLVIPADTTGSVVSSVFMWAQGTMCHMGVQIPHWNEHFQWVSGPLKSF